MKKRKKIDELYRERLNHVETTPPIDVWQNISDRLPEKEKRRILPFWYSFAGTAAAIALIVYMFNLSEQTSSSTNQITSSSQQEYNFVNPISREFQEKMNSSSAILEATVLETKFEIFKQELLSHNNQDHGLMLKNKTSVDHKDSRIVEDRFDNDNARLAENLKNPVLSQIAQIQQEIESQLNSSKEQSEIANTESIENQEEVPNTLLSDLLALELEAEQKLQDKKSKEDITEKSNLSKRFSVSPTAAAVYLDNFGSGNILDNQFSNSESGGQVSMSYGVNLSYQVSEKFRIRSGVNKINLAHNTRGIGFATLTNSQSINIESSESITIPNESISNSASGRNSVNQNLGFIELPLEMEYVLSEKKMGISLIGGVSTLFLENNGVAFNTGESSTYLGEANNINDLSFSANIGVGLNYPLSPSFQFNLEPILKYQINTFDNNSNLHAYYFGIYSGLRFKF